MAFHGFMITRARTSKILVLTRPCRNTYKMIGVTRDDISAAQAAVLTCFIQLSHSSYKSCTLVLLLNSFVVFCNDISSFIYQLLP